MHNDKNISFMFNYKSGKEALICLAPILVQTSILCTVIYIIWSHLSTDYEEFYMLISSQPGQSFAMSKLLPVLKGLFFFSLKACIFCLSLVPTLVYRKFSWKLVCWEVLKSWGKSSLLSETAVYSDAMSKGFSFPLHQAAAEIDLGLPEGAQYRKLDTLFWLKMDIPWFAHTKRSTNHFLFFKSF